LAKTRPGISVESDIWEHFRSEVPHGKRSEVVQRLMQDYLEVESNDLEELKNRLDKKKAELDSLNADKKNLERDIEEKKSEIKALESKISEESRRNERRQEEFERFLEVFSEQSWSSPDDIPEYWVEQIELPAEDLLQKGRTFAASSKSLEEVKA